VDDRVQPTTPDDIRRMIAEDGFADLVDGQLRAIPHSEKLVRALALAAACGHLTLVEDLLREGADPARGVDALIAAAEADHAAVVVSLVNAGVPVDARCEMFGASALMHAAGSGATEGVAALLALGAAAAAVDREGRTARGWAEMGAGSPHWEQWSMPAGVAERFRRVFDLLPPTKPKAG
jgi:ankyrin repeat protein